MLTLPAPFVAETTRRDTTPGYLVEIAFATPWRAATRGRRSFNGHVWQDAPRLAVSGLIWEGRAVQAGTVEIGNADGAFGLLCLAEPPSERACNIWLHYSDADPLLTVHVRHVFEGVIDACRIAADRVTLTLKSSGMQRAWSPRRFVSRASGFNHLVPEGTLFQIGDETFRLDRGQE